MDKNNDPIEKFLDLVCETGMSEIERKICLGLIASVAGMLLGVIVGFISVTPYMLYVLSNLPNPSPPSYQQK